MLIKSAFSDKLRRTFADIYRVVRRTHVGYKLFTIKHHDFDQWYLNHTSMTDVIIFSSMISSRCTLYRGIIPVLQSLCASNFVYFYAFHGLKQLRSRGNHTAGSDLLMASIAGTIKCSKIRVNISRNKIRNNRSAADFSSANNTVAPLRNFELKTLENWNFSMASALLINNRTFIDRRKCSLCKKSSKFADFVT